MCDEATGQGEYPRGEVNMGGTLKGCDSRFYPPSESHKPTLRERLEKRRSKLAEQLARVEEALRVLYSNPEAERIVEVVNRSGV